MLVLERSAGAVGGALSAEEREARRRQREPWSSRADWAQGRIESTTGLRGKWGCAIFLNLFIWAFAFGIWLVMTQGGQEPFRPTRTETAGMFIVFIGVVMAVVYLGRAIGRTYQAARSGRSVFVMSAVPGIVGGSLEGVIHGRLRMRGDQGVCLILKCVVSSTTHSVDGTEMESSVDWDDDRVVSATEITMAGGEALIPVDVTIPAFCPETAENVERPNGCDSVSWRLEARAEPGHAWRAEFEVPVFRTEASPPQRQPSESHLYLRDTVREMVRAGEEQQQQRAAAGAEPTPRPASSRIIVRPPISEGVLIEYPAPPLFVGASAWWLLTLPLYVVLPLDLLRLDLMGPFEALAVVAVLNGLPGYLMVYHWPRRLLIGPHAVTLYCGWPFFGARRRLPTSEAERVHVEQWRRRRGSPRRHLAIVRKERTGLIDRHFFVAASGTHAEARWLAAEIERALARYRGPC